MRAALCAVESRPGDVAGNVGRLEAMVREHADWGVDVLVAGEVVVQGFEGITFDPEHDRALAWEIDGPEMTRMGRLAREVRMALCFGYLERAESRLHSSAVVLGRDGTVLANYRRMSRGWRFGTEDPAVYVEGIEPVTFELADKRCTITLCGDMFTMPERFAAMKPDVALWPVHRSGTPELWAGGELQTYAEQANEVYASVLMANNVWLGDDSPDERAYGGAAWFRNGKVKASSPADGTPGALVVDVL